MEESQKAKEPRRLEEPQKLSEQKTVSEKKVSGKTDIRSLNLDELECYLTSLGEKRFRARQLYQWLHVHGATDYEQMTNLPLSLRRKLSEDADLCTLRQIECQVSSIDGTRKYLFALEDGNMVESVLMRYHHGNSVCVSSQVGCRMGCRFCASTLGGWIRDLVPAEMLEQVYRIQSDTKERVSNVVVMGTGEPLDNFCNVVKFIRMLSDDNGLHISQRNITISTCGIVPEIYRLADLKLQITLAISLHAPTQQIRRTMMPVADRYDLSEVMDACRYYYKTTGRRITFEYALASSVNDSPRDAALLAGLIGGMPCHVNLIPVNPVRERSFHQSTRQTVEAFRAHLEKYGINVTIRREMGRDIDGACGQLRRRRMQEGSV